MIRKAVGAIVKFKEEFLLIHKAKIMDTRESPIEIEAEWDFPKGGIKEDDTDLGEAILRELEEETGSNQYIITKKLDKILTFSFPLEIQKKLGFKFQETVMFLVEYIGDKSDLNLRDEEIVNFGFFSKEEVIEKLHHQEMKDYFVNVAFF